MDYKQVDIYSADNRRRHKRVKHSSSILCTSCYYMGEKVEMQLPAVFELVNISTEGLGIKSDIKLQNGSLLVLNIELEGKNYENVTAKVMWSMSISNGFKHGLHISNISGRLFSHICNLDNSIMTEV